MSAQLRVACLRHHGWGGMRVLGQARTFAVTSIPVPNMGDSISEGTVLKFNRKVGDQLAVDEIVAVIETDKVSVDIRSPLAGVMTELCAKAGDTVQVGMELFKVDSDGKGVASSATPSAAVAASAAAAAAPPLAPASPKLVAASSTPAAAHARVPLIKFTHGKRRTPHFRLL